jgi:protein-S-isoprenylcysteine O-methyltransferase Ste14
VIAALLTAAAVGADMALGDTRVVHWPWRWIGLAFLPTGVCLAAWALRCFAARGTTHNPFGAASALVTTGPFRFTRNPMYLGVTLILLGIGLLMGTLPLLLVPVAFFLTMAIAFVPREERALEAAFGEEFRSWRARVRRWL